MDYGEIMMALINFKVQTLNFLVLKKYDERKKNVIFYKIKVLTNHMYTRKEELKQFS